MNKKNAKARELSNFEHDLLNVRGNCEFRARNSIHMCQTHDNHIKMLENKERNLLGNL